MQGEWPQAGRAFPTCRCSFDHSVIIYYAPVICQAWHQEPEVLIPLTLEDLPKVAKIAWTESSPHPLTPAPFYTISTPSLFLNVGLNVAPGVVDLFTLEASLWAAIKQPSGKN